MPYILAVSGLKDSGKTTLCGELLTRLRQKGHTVGYVKHSSHSLRSPENTDTGKMLKLGIPVVHCAPDGVLLELEENPPLEILLAQYFLEKDLVLLEGGKHLPLPRIWVGAPETVPPEVKGIIAYWNPPEKDVPDSSEYGEGGENRLVERIEKLFVSGEAKPENAHQRFRGGFYRRRHPGNAALSQGIFPGLSGRDLPFSQKRGEFGKRKFLKFFSTKTLVSSS